MDLDEIKRGLRAEIKKRENEQYFTFQCNVRQMCKDVLVKLEEQESVIAENDKEIAELKEQVQEYALGLYVMQARAEKEARHDKYKLCLAMAQYWIAVGYHCVDDRHKQRAEKRHYKWLELAEKFKEAK